MAEANVPYTFTNGTGNIIDATQVNANFEELETSVNDVDKDQLEADVAAKLGLSSTTAVRRGKAIIAAEEATTSTSYTLLGTADRVQNVVLPTDGLLFVAYSALVKGGAGGNSTAAIFLGSNQLKRPASSSAPVVQEATFSVGNYTPLGTYSSGLVAGASGSNSSNVTTGQIIGGNGEYGVCALWAAAGTYDVSVRFKAYSGDTVTAKERKLWVWTQAF